MPAWSGRNRTKAKHPGILRSRRKRALRNPAPLTGSFRMEADKVGAPREGGVQSCTKRRLAPTEARQCALTRPPPSRRTRLRGLRLSRRERNQKDRASPAAPRQGSRPRSCVSLNLPALDMGPRRRPSPRLAGGVLKVQPRFGVGASASASSIMWMPPVMYGESSHAPWQASAIFTRSARCACAPAVSPSFA